jgi:hypothetical protein
MTIRDAFAAEFGKDTAAAIEAAAASHKNGVHDNPGSDPFKWALSICIGHECMSKYRDDHGVTADPEAIRLWVVEHGDLASHDGDVDYLALLCGVYDPWLTHAEAAS